MWNVIHNVGDLKHPNYTSIERVLVLDNICFDDSYRSVYDFREQWKGKNVILFVIGNFVGGDNSWNLRRSPRLEKHCDWNEIMDMVCNYGAKLGWHTWSHPVLTQLSDEEIIKECTPPFPMKYFAYPFGSINDRVVELVKSLGYETAFSVNKGGSGSWDVLRKQIFNR